jgi:hypothetical protein
MNPSEKSSSTAMKLPAYPHRNIVGGFCRAGHILASEADIRTDAKGGRGCAKCYANKLAADKEYRAENSRIRARMKRRYG